MLNREMLRVARRGDRLRPKFIDPAAPEHLELAEELLAIYRNAAASEMRRGEIDEPVEALVRASADPLLTAAFHKLIQDGAEFQPAAGADYPACRDRLFRCGGALLKRGVDREAYAAGLREDPENARFLTGDIYGDLPENERLTAWRELAAPELTMRYNVALVQGLLLYAGTLSFELAEPPAAELRRLFKYLKFFRLLARVRRASATVVTMEVSGPFALFANTRKYAVQLAAFFPAVLLLKNWRMSARIRWRDRDLTLELDQTSGLRSFYRNLSAYVPEEVTMFHRLFREKGGDWKVVGETPLIDGGDGAVIFPDLSFRREGEGPTVHLELFHRWHRGELERRLDWLAERPEIPLLLGIDRSLTDDAEYAALEAKYPALAGRMFRFRDFPGVDRVRGRLNDFAAKRTV